MARIFFMMIIFCADIITNLRPVSSDSSCERWEVQLHVPRPWVKIDYNRGDAEYNLGYE